MVEHFQRALLERLEVLERFGVALALLSKAREQAGKGKMVPASMTGARISLTARAKHVWLLWSLLLLSSLT